MSPAEVAFLERAVVQLLFVSGRTFSLAGLRDKLRELFLPHPAPTVRAAASVGGFELVQVLLKASGRLERMGLMLDLRGGTVRLTTSPVEPPALRDYFGLLREEIRERATPGHGDDGDVGNTDAGPLGEGALEVLACVAFQQPVGQREIDGYFGGTDKRTVVRRLQHLGLVDCRRGQGPEIGGGRTLWVTTAEFLRRFGLPDVGELRRQLADGAAPLPEGSPRSQNPRSILAAPDRDSDAIDADLVGSGPLSLTGSARGLIAPGGRQPAD